MFVLHMQLLAWEDLLLLNKMKRLLLAELLLVLITIIFVSLNPISRIYIADYLEKISLFLFRTLSDEELNKWYEKKDKYELLQESGGAAY